eukprot:129849-Hanusia_phi.AAC.1
MMPHVRKKLRSSIPSTAAGAESTDRPRAAHDNRIAQVINLTLPSSRDASQQNRHFPSCFPS